MDQMIIPIAIIAIRIKNPIRLRLDVDGFLPFLFLLKIHSKPYYNYNTEWHFTIVKDRKKEIGPGLLNKMLADLNLTKDHLK